MQETSELIITNTKDYLALKRSKLIETLKNKPNSRPLLILVRINM
mgnify:CR=1 FL=1